MKDVKNLENLLAFKCVSNGNQKFKIHRLNGNLQSDQEREVQIVKFDVEKSIIKLLPLVF